MRVFIVANSSKPDVAVAIERWRPWLEQRVQIVGIDTDGTADLGQEQADLILVLGGDGTLLGTARRLRGRQIPLMGVNFGRLGFLASFTPEQFQQHFDFLLRQPRFPVSTRIAIEASVVDGNVDCRIRDHADVEAKRRFVATALNDAVVTAGPPFHMLELEIGADGETRVRYFGDGVIVSTPSGSTAYNISAGGPILSPNVDALCITPICPHSLSFRPVVVSADSVVGIVAAKVNPGTTLFCDGQSNTSLRAGDKVVIRRSPNPVLLVENPHAREWRTLAEKLHWAISPGSSTEAPSVSDVPPT